MGKGASRPPFSWRIRRIPRRHGLRGSVHGWCTVWCTEKPQKTANVHGVQGFAEFSACHVFVSAIELPYQNDDLSLTATNRALRAHRQKSAIFPCTKPCTETLKPCTETAKPCTELRNNITNGREVLRVKASCCEGDGQPNSG